MQICHDRGCNRFREMAVTPAWGKPPGGIGCHRHKNATASSSSSSAARVPVTHSHSSTIVMMILRGDDSSPKTF